MLKDPPLPAPATSLAYGTLPNDKGEFLFAWRQNARLLDAAFFVGKVPTRLRRRVGITADETGITITWRGNQLHIPTTGDKASLNGQKFEIQRIVVESASVGLVLCTALRRMPTPLALQ